MLKLSQEEQERYSRHLILEEFGLEAQEKLKGAKVLVVGAGGLGCPALLYLCAAGVGTIGIIDHDIVSLSNLQRQVMYGSGDVGKLKVEVAKEVIGQKNPNVEVRTYSERITSQNALEILREYDLVLDGTDNFATRYLLNDACVILKKPLVYGAIFKFEGQVSVFNLNDGPTYRCLFPEAPAAGEIPSCSEIGVLGVLPGIVGTWQAAEAIKIISGVGEPLSGKLLSFSLLTNEINLWDVHAVEENKQISVLEESAIGCDIINELEAKDFFRFVEENQAQLIDVREENEFMSYNIGGKNIPLSELHNRINELENEPTVVVCRVGQRSQTAINLIRGSRPDMELYNLKNGIMGLKAVID